MLKNWYLGFLGFIGLRGIDGLVTRNWAETVWLVWFVWLVYFLPLAKKGGRRTKHSNFSIMLAVLFILIGIVVYAAPHEARLDAVSANAWKEFGMPAYDGLHFWYPPTYNLATRDFGNGERGHYQIILTEKGTAPAPPQSEGPTAVTLDVFDNMEGYSTEQWIRGTSFSNFKLSDGNMLLVQMGDEPALAYAWSGLYEGRSVVIARRNHIFMLSATYLTPNDDTLRTMENVLKTIEFH